MNPSGRRLRRWAFRGALVLAATAIVLGLLFTILVATAEGKLPTDGPGWAALFLGTALLWGGGGLFFGAILGLYASMIWRDSDV